MPSSKNVFSESVGNDVLDNRFFGDDVRKPPHDQHFNGIIATLLSRIDTITEKRQ